ncbi:Glutathione S-transferase S1 [Mortierella sp. AD094]|nr:Glutathione S-transferase S1 [Mortierella sp. AD094]
MALTIFTPSLKSLINENGSKTDSSFEVLYFGLFGVSATFLTMLAIAGVKFKTIEPKDWPSIKPTKPFGYLPVLKETTSDGKVIEIVESDAIERYIGQKFGFSGDDLYEETIVNIFLSSSASVLEQYYTYALNEDPKSKAEARVKFFSEVLPQWVATHERHLQANGSTGHYLDSKVTAADIKSTLIVRLALTHTGDEIISEEKTPALWKLKSEIENIPNLQKWAQTEEYKALAKCNIEVLEF